MKAIVRSTDVRSWRVAAFTLCVVKAASVVSVVFRIFGPQASNPTSLLIYYAGIVSPTLICLCMFFDARQHALAARAQIFWATMSVVVPIFTVAVYTGHILRHLKI